MQHDKKIYVIIISVMKFLMEMIKNIIKFIIYSYKKLHYYKIIIKNGVCETLVIKNGWVGATHPQNPNDFMKTLKNPYQFY